MEQVLVSLLHTFSNTPEVLVTLRSIATAFLVFLAVPAFALPTLSIGNATRSDKTITIGNASRVESTITMTLSLSDTSNSGITGLESYIKFDPNIFEPDINGSTSSVASKSLALNHKTEGFLKIALIGFGETSPFVDGEIAKILFTLKPQTNPSDSLVKVVSTSFAPSGWQELFEYNVPKNLLTADTAPDSFSFVPQTNVARGVVVQSAPITVSGINGAAPVSVSNGEFSIDGGTWLSAAGATVKNGQQVIVKHTTSSAFSTTTTTTLSINGISAAFTSTTVSRALGDITGNGMVPALSDALLILQSVVGINKLTAEQRQYADMNSDGRVDVGDALLILAKVVGL